MKSQELVAKGGSRTHEPEGQGYEPRCFNRLHTSHNSWSFCTDWLADTSELHNRSLEFGSGRGIRTPGL